MSNSDNGSSAMSGVKAHTHRSEEPGTGEINYPAIATALEDLGYSGVVGLEAWASGDDHLALELFRGAFTAPYTLAGLPHR